MGRLTWYTMWQQNSVCVEMVNCLSSFPEDCLVVLYPLGISCCHCQGQTGIPVSPWQQVCIHQQDQLRNTNKSIYSYQCVCPMYYHTRHSKQAAFHGMPRKKKWNQTVSGKGTYRLHPLNTNSIPLSHCLSCISLVLTFYIVIFQHFISTFCSWNSNLS